MTSPEVNKGGRPAGVANKNKRGLSVRLKQQYGKDFDVIMMMAQNCLTLHEIANTHREGLVSENVDGSKYIDASTSSKTANEALEKLAQYIEPKLKAVEITGVEGGPVQAAVSFTFKPVGKND